MTEINFIVFIRNRCYNKNYGNVAERFKALVLKTRNLVDSWVRIPPFPFKVYDELKDMDYHEWRKKQKIFRIEEDAKMKSIFCDDKPYSCDYESVANLCKIKKGDIFIDIGANLGQEIEYFARRGLFLDSYEPHPVLYKNLKEKYLGYSNITLNNVSF